MNHQPIKNIIVVRKIDGRENTNVLEIYDNIIDSCCKFNISVSEIECPSPISDMTIPENALFVAIGGDGTMICAAKQAAHFDSPIIGFNIGKRGFLSDFDPNKVEETIYSAITGDLRLKERSMINVYAEKEMQTALNDVCISNLYSDVLIHYEIIINGYTTGNHLSNSLIISTPTGSTAYALSVGGAILDPEAEVIEIIPVAPISLTSAMRPMIVPKDYNIEIKLKPRFDSCSYSIKLDGQTAFSLDAKEEVSIKINDSRQKAKFLHDDNWSFYETLSTKLGWAKL